MTGIEAKNRDVFRVQSGENYSLYTKNGKKHNLSGPALVIESDNYYYVKGERYTWSQWTDYVTLYTAYEEDPAVEKECFVKASDSSDGIFIKVKSETSL